MIVQKKDESRIEYLTRVLYSFMNNTSAGCETVYYDGTSCNGVCLANDFMDELGLANKVEEV